MTQSEITPSPTVSVPRSEAEIAARVKALESIMIEKGLMTTEAVDRFAEVYENEVGPQLGAGVVAKAWTDPEFKARLLEDGTKACAELGIGGLQGEDMVVLENTDTVHNVIVCTLCSCYPWPTLGLPPAWYKSPPYRSRAVIDPRGTLREFGLELDDDVEIRDLVLPERPAGTEHLTEAQLAELVTRDSMVGVAKVTMPKGAGV